MKRDIKEIEYTIILSIYFFLYIFLPPILGINIRLIMTLISIVISICAVMYCGRGRVILSRNVIKASSGLIFFIIIFYIMQFFRVLNDIEHQNEIVEYTNGMSHVIFYIVSSCIFLAVLIKTLRISYAILIKSFVYSGVIELLFVILSYTFDSLRFSFIQLIAENSTSERVTEVIRKYTYERGYGLSNDLFDSFGYITALIIMISILIGFETKQVRFIVLSLLLLIMPLLNSRTGLLLSVVSLLIIVISYVSFKNMLVISSVLIVLFSVVDKIKYLLPKGVRLFVERGISQTLALFNGKIEGVYAEILVLDMKFPEDLLWGVGYPPEYIGLIGIDSGYVQCIWRYGVVGSIFLVAAMLLLFLSSIKKTNEKGTKVLLICIMCMFFLYLFKLYSFGNTGANIIVFGVPIMVLLTNETEFMNRKCKLKRRF